MWSRRQFPALAALAAMFVLPRVSAARAAEPRAFVHDVGDQLVNVINGPGGFAEKRAQLQRIVDRAVDVDGIARFCLGRFWRLATPQQQQDYVALFHQVLLNSIAGHLGEYKGVHYVLGRTTPHDDLTWVSTTISRPNNPDADVEWVISMTGGGPKIEDLVVEGVSLRLTQRSDYASYLQHNGNSVQALIDAMRRILANQKQG